MAYELWFVGGCVAIIATQLAQSVYQARKTAEFLELFAKTTQEIVSETLEKQPENPEFEALERLNHIERRMNSVETDCKTWLARANTRHNRAQKILDEFEAEETPQVQELPENLAEQIDNLSQGSPAAENGQLSLDEIRSLAAQNRRF